MLTWLIKTVYAAGPGGDPTAPAGTPTIPNYGGTGAAHVSTFSDLVTTVINSILNPLILLVFGLALVTFLWGVLKYMGKGEDKEREEGRKLIVYGIIALAVMVSVWGLVNIVIHTFNLDTSAVPVPKL